MGMSAKDKCFDEAIEQVEKVGGQKIGVTGQQGWLKDMAGNWSPLGKGVTFDSLFGSIRKTLEILKGNILPRAPGAPNPVQVRYPDMTVDTPGGKVVVDNKFTNGKGGIDPWGNKPGTGGDTQLNDYNDINNKNTNGNPKAKNLSLDKDICKCDPKGKPEPVRVYRSSTAVSMDPALQRVFVMPLPFGPLPVMPGLPAMPGIRIPLRIPFPALSPA